jgi:uncharacterized membrane protein YvbJ
MANFCANCGAGLGGSASSCPRCGTPVSDGRTVIDARQLADATTEHVPLTTRGRPPGEGPDASW